MTNLKEKVVLASKMELSFDRMLSLTVFEKLLIKFVLNRELEEVFGVPVYDRYMVVIQIFREHAVTKEAKLQITMAEIPYLRYNIRTVYFLSGYNFLFALSKLYSKFVNFVLCRSDRSLCVFRSQFLFKILFPLIF
jgi:hypothetical protein